MTLHGNRFIIYLFVSLLLAAGQPVAAQAACQEGSAYAYFILKTSGSNEACTVVVPTVGLVTIEVWLSQTVPLTKARFSLPDPPFGDVLSEVYEYPHTGDRATGVELDLGGCVTGFGTVKLATFSVFVLTDLTGQCVQWKIDDSPEVVDCDGITRRASGRYHEFSTASGCCYEVACGLPPFNVFPPDSATDVPLDVELSWQVEQDLNDHMQLAIGTDPECGDLAFYFFSGNSFAPDFLLPGTTYYWWVGWSYFECNGTSPTMTFTTGGGVSAETTTWGRIKSLYE